MHHFKTKHIEVEHHFIRHDVTRGDIALDYVKFKSNPTDIFTSP